MWIYFLVAWLIREGSKVPHATYTDTTSPAMTTTLYSIDTVPVLPVPLSEPPPRNKNRGAGHIFNFQIVIFDSSGSRQQIGMTARGVCDCEGSGDDKKVEMTTEWLGIPS